MLTDEYIKERNDARALLKQAVELKGADYVYPPSGGGGACNYLEYTGGSRRTGKPTGPSCVVGHVLVAKGIPMLDIAPHEGDSAETVARLVGAFRDEIVGGALSEAQSVQDNGDTWGEALAAFESFITANEADHG